MQLFELRALLKSTKIQMFPGTLVLFPHQFRRFQNILFARYRRFIASFFDRSAFNEAQSAPPVLLPIGQSFKSRTLILLTCLFFFAIVIGFHVPRLLSDGEQNAPIPIHRIVKLKKIIFQ